jgi:hypothetical protein
MAHGGVSVASGPKSTPACGPHVAVGVRLTVTSRPVSKPRCELSLAKGGSTMWARVAAFEGTDVERARAEVGRRPAEDLIPPGLRGILSLVDADGKRQLFISFFDSREKIEAAEPVFERMGDQIPEELRGRRVSRDYYEVAAGTLTLVGELR